MEQNLSKTHLTREQVLALLPRRAPESHKGSFGKVLCVCGCPQYRGAAALCALGALRSGAGLVTLAAPEVVLSSVASRILEATFLLLPDDAALAAAAQSCTVCAAGCGKPVSSATATEMQLLLGSTRGTLLLDAGGLVSLAGRETLLAQASGRLIVTPHPGEMARLTQLSVEQVLANSASLALEYARRTGAVVVLKLHRTLIATPEGALYENTTGNAGLARGGSGDVLSGIIAGLAACGLSPSVAAVCGVYLHGAAADLCAAQCSMQAMLPEDLLDDLGTLFLEKERGM